MFARYGVPNVLVTDNGPQFSSAEFLAFARMWDFQHVTSSPRYPQSNGKAESAVKSVKWLFTKCQEARQSEYQALLDWRNTSIPGLGTCGKGNSLFRSNCRLVFCLSYPYSIATRPLDARTGARSPLLLSWQLHPHCLSSRYWWQITSLSIVVMCLLGFLSQ